GPAKSNWELWGNTGNECIRWPGPDRTPPSTAASPRLFDRWRILRRRLRFGFRHHRQPVGTGRLLAGRVHRLRFGRRLGNRGPQLLVPGGRGHVLVLAGDVQAGPADGRVDDAERGLPLLHQAEADARLLADVLRVRVAVPFGLQRDGPFLHPRDVLLDAGQLGALFGVGAQR